jgi:hypothetical protein
VGVRVSVDGFGGGTNIQSIVLTDFKHHFIHSFRSYLECQRGPGTDSTKDSECDTPDACPIEYTMDIALANPCKVHSSVSTLHMRGMKYTEVRWLLKETSLMTQWAILDVGLQ